MSNMPNRSGLKDKKTEEYLNIVGDIIVALDSRGKITLLNKQAYKILGYKEGELLGKNWFETCVPKENRKEVEKIHKKHVFGGTKRVENYESPLLTKKGKKRMISWSITWLKDDQGKIKGTLSSGEDITLRKEAEKALEESEKKYRDLIEKEKDIIYTLDNKGKITFASPAVETILGYQPGEVVGKNFMVLIPKEWQERTGADFNNLLKKGEITAETVLLDKKGQPHFVEYSSTVIKEDNKVVGTQGIVRDITERKKMEKQIFDSNKRLQRAAQELKVAIETKGEFMNIAAHELRTPLQPIIGYADRLLQKGNPTDWQKERLNIILDNAKNLLKLVQDVLDINKMETGIMKFSMEEVDLLKIIKDVYSSFKPAVEERGLKFILDIPKISGEIKIKGDPSRLNQVFSNLLGNAVKFTDKGIIAIQVKENKDTAIISVKDTGIGIAKDDMKKLFHKFFQADVTDKRKVGGTGLGLAICKEIVKAHNGKISAQSTLGKGSTFIVVLPKLVRSS